MKAPKSTLLGLLLLVLLGVGLATGVVTDWTFAGAVFAGALSLLPTNWFRESTPKDNLNE
ncbi:hypothetical protein [Rufibacter immobilis]|nr:hypothetical protein [Rufibacter immobilis]